MSWKVELLSDEHARREFHCGVAHLDDYLHKYAGQHHQKNFGRTFVAVRSGEKQVLGYCTLSSSSVRFENLPDNVSKKLPRYPVPVALLGKLAVHVTQQGHGLGAFLLLDALHRIVEVAGQLAVYAVEVHAIDDKAKAFYLKYGFIPFEDQPLHLFLPLSTIRKSFSD